MEKRPLNLVRLNVIVNWQVSNMDTMNTQHVKF
jgi:hypothetical protein